MGERIRVEWTKENAEALASELRALRAERDQLWEELCKREAVVKAARAYMAKPFNEDDAEIVNLQRALTALDRTGEAPEAVSRFYGGAVSPEFVADAIDRETTEAPPT